MLETLLPNIEQYPTTSDAYFWLLDKLLQSCAEVTRNIEWRNKFVLSLVSAIASHPILEAGELRDEDKGLIGLFNLIRSMVKRDAALKELVLTNAECNLVTELFDSCLFAIPVAENHGIAGPPKCKTRACRYAALRLLAELIKGRPVEFKLVADLLLAQFSSGTTSLFSLALSLSRQSS